MREYIIKQTNKITKQSKFMLDIVYSNKEMAYKAVNHFNNKNTNYIYKLIELVEVEEILKPFYDMSEAEEKEYNRTILEIDDDLHKIISYDEWAGREYGETSVDYYSTAISLYQAGYRKVKEIKYEEKIEEETL